MTYPTTERDRVVEQKVQKLRERYADALAAGQYGFGTALGRLVS